MAKTSIYLPDDLADQARTRGIPISEVAQAAVRQAVKDAQLKEDVVTDLQAVAERMREIQRLEAIKSGEEDLRVRGKGAEWARRYATATDLEYVATFHGETGDYHSPLSVFTVVLLDSGWKGLPTGPGDTRWDHFQAGAREIWEAVRPLLAGNGEERPRGH